MAARRSNAKVLQVRYNEVVRDGEKEGIFIEPIKDDKLGFWTVHLKNFPPESKIEHDLQILKKKYNIDSITLKFEFSEEFPIKPPFMYVASPLFTIDDQKHVLSDYIMYTGFTFFSGSVCWDILTPGKWSQIYSIMNLLRQFKILLIDGGVRLDTTKEGGYSVDSAKRGYSDILRYHPDWR